MLIIASVIANSTSIFDKQVNVKIVYKVAMVKMVITNSVRGSNCMVNVSVKVITVAIFLEELITD